MSLCGLKFNAGVAQGIAVENFLCGAVEHLHADGQFGILPVHGLGIFPLWVPRLPFFRIPLTVQPH